jgi:hypothetical protein
MRKITRLLESFITSPPGKQRGSGLSLRRCESPLRRILLNRGANAEQQKTPAARLGGRSQLFQLPLGRINPLAFSTHRA